MFKSIQWKLVVIYSLIILFTMQFFAVFLSQALEDYYIDSFSNNIESQGLLLSNLLEKYLKNAEETNAIDSLVQEYSRYAGTAADIIVLDAFGRVISSSNQGGELIGQRIIQEEVTRALTGSRSEAIRLDPETRERKKYLALPVRGNDRNLGVVYFVGSLEPIYQTLREIQWIFLTGSLLVIAVTVLLGVILAKTITVPIQEVTSKAGQIAHGDYRQRITIRSQDEIGHLGEMFNYLSQQLEATLREISSEKGKVEAILKNMTDGIIAIGREGQILHVNPTARRLLNIAQDVDPTMDELSHLVSQINLTEVMHADKRESRESLLPLQQKIILANYVPFHTQDAGGSLSGVLIVLHDVTKERELTRMQQDFVANVSHELRTPLTTLKSYTETLLGGAMSQPEVRLSFLSTMEKEIDRMVRLVKDLLTLSQMDHSRAGWQIEEHNVADIIVEVVNDLKVEYKTQLRRVTVSLPVIPTVVHADRDKIKQVLINIIQNAYKYTRENGRIDISLEQSNNNAIIYVRDDGIGIPPEDTERVFERFYRVDKARSREYGGTGLGLSIARDIVAAHRGTITMQSGLKQGTTVIITLPLSDDKEADGICGNG